MIVKYEIKLSKLPTVYHNSEIIETVYMTIISPFKNTVTDKIKISTYILHLIFDHLIDIF